MEYYPKSCITCKYSRKVSDREPKYIVTCSRAARGGDKLDSFDAGIDRSTCRYYEPRTEGISETKKPVARSAKYVPVGDRESYAVKQINWWEKAYKFMNSVFDQIGRKPMPVVRASQTELRWGRSRLYYSKEMRDLVFSDSLYDSAYVDYYLVHDAVAEGKLNKHPFISRAIRPAGYAQWKSNLQKKLEKKQRSTK